MLKIDFKYVNQTLAMMALKKRLIARMYICEPGNGSIKNMLTVRIEITTIMNE